MAKGGKPTPDQLSRINQLARSPLTEEEVYVFPCKVIGDNLIPKYCMKLSQNLLQKFADQTKKGIALLVDHPWQKWFSSAKSIPYGRTFDSLLRMDGEELALYADHYMVLGQQLDDISTDSLASGIDAGTIFDTSAGFVTTKHLCSICKENYFSGDCEHIRGQLYDEGKTLCYIVADDGYIMENSLVFDGAYETAGIGMSKGQNSQHQQQEPFVTLDLSNKSLPGDGEVFWTFSAQTGAKAFIRRTDEMQNLDKSTGEVNALSVSASNVNHNKERNDGNVSKEQQLEQALNSANGLLGQIRTALSVQTDIDIMTSLNSVLTKAKDGETYKEELIEQALGAGVRALGSNFDAEAMKSSFNVLSAAQVKNFRDMYETQAKQALGGGGRHTVGDEQGLPDDKKALNSTELTDAEKDRAQARAEARQALVNTGYSHVLKEEK